MIKNFFLISHTVLELWLVESYATRQRYTKWALTYCTSANTNLLS